MGQKYYLNMSHEDRSRYDAQQTEIDRQHSLHRIEVMDFEQIELLASQCNIEYSLFGLPRSSLRKFVAAIEAHERQRIADKLKIDVALLEE